ncbi:MAG: response regulator transcription factor [Balneolaceae bacterium]
MPPKHTILLVEDEMESAEMLSGYLSVRGFRVLVSHDGMDAHQKIDRYAGEIRLAILDIMVPGKDGLEICKTIRSHPVISDIPVIFLTARDRERDEIEGLELGADDYIGKPASLKLVHTRVQALLRRSSQNRSSWLQQREFYLDTEGKQLWKRDEPVLLTSTEYSILELLFRHPARVFDRQEILETISGEEKFVFDRTVDVHIKNLRLKLGESASLIRTVRGIGYGLNREGGQI